MARACVWMVGVGLVLGVWPGVAFGQARDATLRSTRGQPVELSRYRGKPAVLLYEDKDSTRLNQPFKDELFARAEREGWLGRAHLVPVANLTAFDSFPARRFAVAHVRGAERALGVPILVDLKGALAAPPWNLPPRSSSVVLLDAQGRVAFQHSGPLGTGEVEAFFAALEGLLGGGGPAAALP